MKRWLQHNGKLKLLALALACFTWGFVNGITNDQRLISDIPLTISVAPNQVLETQSVSRINLTVKGTRDDVRRLSRIEISATINLTDQNRTGEWNVPITPQVISGLPTYVQIAEISPEFVTIRVDDLALHEVPVKESLVGELAAGFRVDRAFVSPRRVNIRGPKTYVDGLQIINTKPIEVTGRRSSFRDRTEVETPPGRGVTVEPRWVDVDVRITEAPLPEPETKP